MFGVRSEPRATSREPRATLVSREPRLLRGGVVGDRIKRPFGMHREGERGAGE
jgi:hypothetical protein